MKTEILIVSYSKDVPWLEWCVKSIEKFAKGFSGITVVFPDDESLPPIDGVNWSQYVRTPDKKKWHLDAQCQKCLADMHCPDADFILHMDSDCIFTEPVTPDDYFENGKPVMLIEEYAMLKGNPWQKVTEEALMFPCQWETMRRHPQVNPIGLYRAVRDYIELMHGMSFRSFMLSRSPDYPWGISEHNMLGSFAQRSDSFKSLYHWIDAGRETVPHEKMKQFWSWGDIDKPQGTPHDGDTCIPIDVIRKIVA